VIAWTAPLTVIPLLRDRPELIERARRELKGKRLGCYCAPKPCHGDVLARVAEGGTP
jgi:hypothetical protein